MNRDIMNVLFGGLNSSPAASGSLAPSMGFGDVVWVLEMKEVPDLYPPKHAGR